MVAALGHRARGMAEMALIPQILAGYPPQYFSPLVAEPGDVFITSWGKSGTTLMQQMFHQIRMIAATGEGDMDFDDISRMTPWEDSAPAIDQVVNGPQRASPRGFKSHRDYERLPAGCRYVVTLRDPHETFVSMFRFLNGWWIEPGTVAMEEFFPFWMGGGPGGCDYFAHLLSWYARRDEPDTLLSTYRWVVRNKREMIRRMAAFMGIEASDALVDKVDEMTSREFMHEHKDRFDDAMFAAALEAKVGIPADSDSSKVQAQGSDAKEVPPVIAAQIDAMWAERIAPVTGHADFASLAEELEG